MRPEAADLVPSIGNDRTSAPSTAPAVTPYEVSDVPGPLASRSARMPLDDDTTFAAIASNLAALKFDALTYLRVAGAVAAPLIGPRARAVCSGPPAREHR
jgi:hypothetical protein